VCTLTICKPRIWSAAQVEDWVAATTAANWPTGPGLLVYAMKVAEKMTMEEYDDWTREELP
jgi:hypothetical protein